MKYSFQQFDLLKSDREKEPKLKFSVWMADKLSRGNCVHSAYDATTFIQLHSAHCTLWRVSLFVANGAMRLRTVRGALFRMRH